MNAQKRKMCGTMKFAIVCFAVTFSGPCVCIANADELSTAKIRLIYDGDIGPDPCDFSTLSMLHQFHSKGMIELVAMQKSFTYL